MALPALLQNVKSRSQFLTVLRSVDADQNGALNKAETESLSLSAEHPSQFYDAASKYHTVELSLHEVAGMMHQSGLPLNTLFSDGKVDQLKRIENRTPSLFFPIHPEAVNEWLEKGPDTGQIRSVMLTIAELLTWSDTNGPEENEFYKHYVDHLSPKALYHLLWAGSDDLWGQVWDRVTARFESLPNVPEVIQAADPTHNLLPGFFLKMVAYGHSGFYLQRHKDLMYGAVMNVVRNSSHYFIPKYLPALEALAASAKETADQLGAALLSAYQERGETDHGRVYHFLLWSLRKYWRTPAVKEVAKDPLDMQIPPIPERWLADGMLQAVVIFAYDQKAHWDQMIHTYQKLGFSVTHLPENPAVTQEVALKKRVSGITLRLDVVYAPKQQFNMASIFSRPDVDILSVRAHHSTAQDYLNLCTNCGMQSKLVLNGGCDGVSSLDDLMALYKGNFFIADKNRGKGHDNNLVLYHVMRALAAGVADWGALSRSVQASVPARQWGIMFPNDDLFKFYYVLHTPMVRFLKQIPYNPLADTRGWAAEADTKTQPKITNTPR
jgi:hypothetical protein